MADWIEKRTDILVESSYDPGAGAERYRFWDDGHAIPRPSEGVVRAQIRIESRWEDMFYNGVWGQAHDDYREGIWLKQKASRHFSAVTGRSLHLVRYQLNK